MVDLECHELVKTFGDFTAVDRVSLAVPKGSFFSILGPSGCGKTTLMRMLAGFERPDSGDIHIKGRSMLGIPPNQRPVNMVFQHLALFPNMSVADNVGYGLRRRRVAKPEIGRRVQEVLERVGLGDSGAKRIDQLSGGQKQRVAIARCLVLNPAVLLLDEPLGALDLKLREQMKVELKKLQSEFGTTFIYITHDQSEALVMSDQVAVMNRGRFEQVGSPQDLYYRPLTPFVAAFVGDSNRWRGRVEGRDGDTLHIVTGNGMALKAGWAHPERQNHSEEVEVFVRPEMIRIELEPRQDGADNHMTARVSSLLFDGARSQVLVTSEQGGQEMMVNLPQAPEFARLRPGDRVWLSWYAEQSHAFSAGAVA
ncbi:MAG TPA: ABC transporter ATP-binding protein [Sedimenticola thiotaurini]|uniref:ABC transporter ATP-binding protein n=1 Tax=Sedimenticola thiotaurini TaxID=1543721 RepID=A0A831RJF7_9GAMM|nr:ABC transporter ATP-binding protein [Sedimenticola thiotaurini]